VLAYDRAVNGLRQDLFLHEYDGNSERGQFADEPASLCAVAREDGDHAVSFNILEEAGGAEVGRLNAAQDQAVRIRGQVVGETGYLSGDEGVAEEVRVLNHDQHSDCPL